MLEKAIKLRKWSNPRGSRTNWESHNPLEAGGTNDLGIHLRKHVHTGLLTTTASQIKTACFHIQHPWFLLHGIGRAHCPTPRNRNNEPCRPCSILPFLISFLVGYFCSWSFFISCTPASRVRRILVPSFVLSLCSCVLFPMTTPIPTSSYKPTLACAFYSLHGFVTPVLVIWFASDFLRQHRRYSSLDALSFSMGLSAFSILVNDHFPDRALLPSMSWLSVLLNDSAPIPWWRTLILLDNTLHLPSVWYVKLIFILQICSNY